MLFGRSPHSPAAGGGAVDLAPGADLPRRLSTRPAPRILSLGESPETRIAFLKCRVVKVLEVQDLGRDVQEVQGLLRPVTWDLRRLLGTSALPRKGPRGGDGQGGCENSLRKLWGGGHQRAEGFGRLYVWFVCVKTQWLFNSVSSRISTPSLPAVALGSKVVPFPF